MIKVTNKNRIAAITIISTVIILILAGLFLFMPNQYEIMVPGNVAMTVDGLNVSVGFYNYFYSSSTTPEILIELEKRYEGFDQTVPLNEQIYDAETGETWADYTAKTVEEQISFLVKAYNEGIKAGVTVFEEQQKNIDSIIDSLEVEAKELFVDIDDYAGYTYGDYVGEKTVRKILEMSYIAQNYYEYFVVNNDLSQEEYENFFESNKSKFISVEYLCCKITGYEIDVKINVIKIMSDEAIANTLE